ncbi:hypothetical protein B0H10DRAFT_1942245 [Mycena sp. CBHHK59/15]|nr:hypothetical protein B0H10DRAFT_1942245 [Mycena sp. CBHHK59/15]
MVATCEQATRTVGWDSGQDARRMRGGNSSGLGNGIWLAQVAHMLAIPCVVAEMCLSTLIKRCGWSCSRDGRSGQSGDEGGTDSRGQLPQLGQMVLLVRRTATGPKQCVARRCEGRVGTGWEVAQGQAGGRAAASQVASGLCAGGGGGIAGEIADRGGREHVGGQQCVQCEQRAGSAEWLQLSCDVAWERVPPHMHKQTHRLRSGKAG